MSEKMRLDADDFVQGQSENVQIEDRVIELKPDEIDYPEGTIAIWNIDSGDGDEVLDDEGDFDGDIDGADWVEDEDAPGGYALEFNRSAGDHVEIDNDGTFEGLSDFTVAATVVPDNLSDNAIVVGITDSSGSGSDGNVSWMIRYRDDSRGLQLRGNAPSTGSRITQEIDTDYHFDTGERYTIVCRWRGSDETGEIYINNVDETDNVQYDNETFDVVGYPLTFGGSTGGARGWDGRIEQVTFAEGAWSEEMIGEYHEFWTDSE